VVFPGERCHQNALEFQSLQIDSSEVICARLVDEVSAKARRWSSKFISYWTGIVLINSILMGVIDF